MWILQNIPNRKKLGVTKKQPHLWSSQEGLQLPPHFLPHLHSVLFETCVQILSASQKITTIIANFESSFKQNHNTHCCFERACSSKNHNTNCHLLRAHSSKNQNNHCCLAQEFLLLTSTSSSSICHLDCYISAECKWPALYVPRLFLYEWISGWSDRASMPPKRRSKLLVMIWSTDTNVFCIYLPPQAQTMQSCHRSELKALSKWVPDLKALKWMGTSAQSSQMGMSAQSSQWVSELKDLSGYPPLSAQFENLFNQLDFIFSFYHNMWETIVQSLQHTTHDAFQYASAKPCILVCTLSQKKNSKELWQTSKYKRHKFGF